MPQIAMTETPALLARAALYQRLAKAFRYPAEDPAYRANLESLLEGAAELGQAQSSDGNLMAAIHALQEAMIGLPESLGLLESEYTYLFARQAPAPPYETSYEAESGPRRVAVLSEIASFYSAFGLELAGGSGELPDHVGAELEFVGFLLTKEAYATARRWTRRADLCRRARDKFVQEHLKCWLPRFRDRLAEHSRRAFYPALAQVALALVAEEVSERDAVR